MVKLQTPSIFRLLIVVGLFFLSGSLFAQNTVSIGTTDLRSDAVLYLVANGNQGLILPAVDNVNTFTPTTAGMLAYNRADSEVYYFNGTNWVGIGGSTTGGGTTYGLAFSGGQLSLVEGGTTDQVTIALLGDVSGDADDVTVTAIQGRSIAATVPTDTQVLAWNDGASQWEPTTISAATGDDWGTQVVVTDGTLTGTGVAGDPLSVVAAGDQTADQVPVTSGAGLAASNAQAAFEELQTEILTNEAGVTANTALIAADNDGSVTNEIQNITFNPGTNTLSLTEPGQPDQTADLSSLAGGATLTPGAGIDITTGVVTNTGDTDASDDITTADITDLGSGEIITTAERTQITSNTTAIAADLDGDSANEIQNVSFDSGTNILSLTEPGQPDQTADLSSLAGGSTLTSGAGIDITGGVVTNTGDTDITDDITTSDITDLGSGEIITITERTNLSNQSGINTGDEVVFNATTDGLVPQPGASTGRVLQDDGTWVTVSGSGDMLQATYDANTNNIVDDAETAQSLSGTITTGQITDITDVGSGEIITITERTNLSNQSGTNTGDEVVFNATTDGLVPQPGASTGRVLQDDGTWITVSGSGDMLQATYDSNTDNIVDLAATVTTNADLTGPVTSTGNATAIANGAITNAMLANGDVANLSGTNTGDASVFVNGSDGLVPDPGPSTGRVLQDDGTWVTVSGSGDMLQSTYDNGGTAGVVDAAESLTGTITASQISDAGSLVTQDGTISTDGTLAGNSDANIPTEQAVKTYVDANIVAIPATTDAQILVSNGTTLSATAMGGDAAISNTGSVTIADGAISGGVAGKIVDGSITSDDIQNGTIAPGDIADDAVTPAKISGNVGSSNAILGSASDGTVNWVEGAPNQLVGTDASGNLLFRDATEAVVDGGDGIRTIVLGASDGVIATEKAVREAIDAVGAPSLQTAYDEGSDISMTASQDLTIRDSGGTQVFSIDEDSGFIGVGNVIPSVAPLEIFTSTNSVGLYTQVATSSSINEATRSVASGASDDNIGVTGDAGGGLRATGVIGQASNGTNNSTGVEGIAFGSGGTELLVGVRGNTQGTSTANTNVGIFGETNSTGATNNVGVYGIASGASNNYAGYFAGNTVIEGDLELFDQGTAPAVTSNKLYNVGGNLFWEGLDLTAASAGTLQSAYDAPGGNIIQQDGTNNLTVLNSGGTATQLFIREADNYIGMGTNAPITNLDVRGQTTDEGSVLNLGNADNSNQLLLFGGRLNDPNPFIQVTDGTPLRFGTSASGFTETMRIAANGDIGIGIDAPTSKLHIFDANTNGITIASGSGNNPFLDFNENGTTSANIFWDGTTDQFNVNTFGSETLINPNGGNVGIGTTTTTAKLTLVPGTTFDGIDLYSFGGADGNAELKFRDNDNDQLVAIKAPDVLLTTFALTLPDALPVADGSVLTGATDGTLSWASVGGGAANLDGLNNVTVGSAGGSITSGDNNVFISGGFANTEGFGNVFMGNNAGQVNTTAGDNTFIGTASGQANVDGDLNTFIGSGTGSGNISGSTITLLGHGSNVGVDNLSNATAVGNGAIVSQSDALVLGNSNVNVGIGTSTPSSKIEVIASNQAMRAFTNGSNIVAEFESGSADATDLVEFKDQGNVVAKIDDTGLGTFINGLELTANSVPSPTTNRLYNSGGDIFWEDINLSAASADGNGIYDGGGALVTATNIDLDDNILNFLSGDSFGEFNILFENANADFFIRDAVSSAFLFAVDGNSGKVGIGTADPKSDLQIGSRTHLFQDGSVNVVLANNISDDFTFTTSNQASYMLLRDGGTIELGNTDAASPTAGANINPFRDVWLEMQADGVINVNNALALSDDSDPARQIQIHAPTTVTADYTLTLPNDNGTGALTNDGSGNLSWSGVTSNGIYGGDGSLSANTNVTLSSNSLNFLGGNFTIGTSNVLTNLADNGIAIGDANNVNGGFLGIAIGSNNTITGNRGIAIGNANNVDHLGAVMLGDWAGQPVSSTTSDQFTARFTEGYRFFASSDPGANPNQGVFIDNNARVGIGTASPSERLDVNGNINISDGSSILVNGSRAMTVFPAVNSVFLGAGTPSSSAGSNTFVGANTGANTTATGNTFLGSNAGTSNIAGSGNVYVGTATGENSLGSNNSYVGIGAGAGNVNGSSVTLIGSEANVGADNLTNATALGANAIVGVSDALVLGGTGVNAVNVGIGTNDPAHTLDVVGSNGVKIAPAAGGFNFLSLQNAATGALSWGINDNTNRNLAFYRYDNAGAFIDTPLALDNATGNIGLNTTNDILFRGLGDQNHGIGFYGASKLWNGLDIDGPVLYGNEGGALGNNNLGTPSTRLTWDLTGVTVFGTFTNLSDARVKENVSELEYGLDELMAFRPVKYDWKEGHGVGTSLGFIAQEVQHIAPEIVSEPKDSSRFYAMSYVEMIPILVKSIQEQQDLIEKQQQLIKSLANADNENKKKLAALEAKVKGSNEEKNTEASTQTQLDELKAQMAKLTQILTAEASKDNDE